MSDVLLSTLLTIGGLIAVFIIQIVLLYIGYLRRAIKQQQTYLEEWKSLVLNINKPINTEEK
jgi:septation ring formation regulator EzrA